jgi:hypothetical protein
MISVETKEFGDRRFEILLERLDRIAAEINQLNRRLDHEEGLLRISRELATLNESLQAIAYAALGTQGPQVRRRRAG